MLVDQFTKSVTKLTGQVRALEESFANEDAQTFMEDAGSCETALQELYSYAKREELDLNRYYHDLKNIADGLRLVQTHARQQMETVYLSERSAWKKSLDLINSALRTVNSLTSLAQASRRY